MGVLAILRQKSVSWFCVHECAFLPWRTDKSCAMLIILLILLFVFKIIGEVRNKDFDGIFKIGCLWSWKWFDFEHRRPSGRGLILDPYVQLIDLRRDNLSLFTVHCLRWRMPPFMRQCWGLPHRLAQCMRPQGWGMLANAALLSLINEACVNVCCATLLSSELVGPAWVQARSSNPRGRACRPWEGIGGGGDIEWRCSCIFIYCPAFSGSVARCLIQACMPAGRPSHSAHLAPSARAER